MATPYGVTSHLLILGAVATDAATAPAPVFGYSVQDSLVPVCFTVEKAQPPKVANDPPVIVNLREPIGLAPSRIQVQVLQGSTTMLDVMADLRSNKRSYQFNLKDVADRILAAHFRRTGEALSSATLSVAVTPWLTTPNEAGRTIEVGEITLTFKCCPDLGPSNSPPIRLQLESTPRPMSTLQSQPQERAQPLKRLVRQRH
jgi:hypothetical protein